MSNMCPFIMTLSESSCVKFSTFHPCTVVALYGSTVGFDEPPPPGAAPPPPPPPLEPPPPPTDPPLVPDPLPEEPPMSSVLEAVAA